MGVVSRMLTLKCQDVLPDQKCPFEMSGEKQDEMVVGMTEHARATHAELVAGMSPERLQALKDRMRELLDQQDAS